MHTAIVVVASAMLAASSLAPQPPKLSPADLKEISGRWIGTVIAGDASMALGLDLTTKGEKLTGTLQTAHGDWTIEQVRKTEAVWTIAFATPDGSRGTMVGRVKDGKLTGDWNFQPRAVGTFELSRPATDIKK